MTWPTTYLFGDPTDAARSNSAGPPTAAGTIPGLEGVHTWFATVNGFLSATPLAALNYRWDTSGNRRTPLPLGLSASGGRVAVGSVAVLDKISGLHSRADFDDNRGNYTGRMGEYLMPSTARGRTITYEGRIIAGSLAALREAEALTRAAYSGTEGAMIVEYNPQYSATQRPWLYVGRVTQFEIIDEQAVGPAGTYPHQRSFVLAIRQHDPRYYAWNTADSAGFQVSSSFTSNGSAHSLTNGGTAPAEPVYVVSSPGSTVTIYNATLDTTLQLTGLPSLSGDTLTVDYGLRLAYRGAFAADLTGYINLAGSNAWDYGKPGLAAGANSVGINGTTGTWVAKWRDAYW